MKKKELDKNIMDNMLTNLNDFMKDFGIEEINFGKTHTIKKTDDDKAEDIIKRRKNERK